MNSVFYSILPIFLITLIGSVIRRKWITSDEFWRGLEKLSFYVLFPNVLFEHSYKIDLSSSEFLRLIIALVIANLIVSVGLIIYQKRTNYDEVHFTSVFQGGTRYNNYILFAMGAALFGEKGLTIVVAISPYMLILTNITSIIIFSYYIRKKDAILPKYKNFILVVKLICANPFVLACLAGVSFNYFEIKLNTGVEKTIHTLADSALAIGILMVGATIQFKIKPEHFKHVFFASGVKLIIMPLATFIVMLFMSVTGLPKSVGIMFSCLPCASSAYILSRQLGGDAETMSSIITFTTVFSILSLSLLVYILG